MAVGTTDLIVSLKKWMKGAASATLFNLFIEANPTPASRPRVTRWGTYYLKTYETFRTKAHLHLNKTKCPGVPEEFRDKPVMAFIECVVEKPKTGKLKSPRGDVDNYVKGPMDVMTKFEKFWNDDEQIQGLIAFKRYAAKGETPGVLVQWFNIAE